MINLAAIKKVNSSLNNNKIYLLFGFINKKFWKISINIRIN